MSEIKLFESKEIRSTLHEGEWFFAVADVVGVLTESVNSGDYWRTLKHREHQLVTNCHKLKMPASNGRMYKIDCANKEGLLRIIQSVPSPKAEPFKKWLANVGSKVLDEKANKRLAAHRKLKETQNRFLDNVMHNILTLANTSPFKKVVLCSAWGVAETNNDLPIWFRWMIDNSNIKIAYKDHEKQEKLLMQSDLNWTIIRPVGLTNSKKIQDIIESFGNEPKPALTISRKSVARYMIDALENQELSTKTPVISAK